jgi:phospholipase C
MPSLPGYRSLPRRVTVSIAAILMTSTALTPTAAVAQQSSTQTPIKHVIIIIGENRTFDHIFATYPPVNKGEKVLNLLSKKIVNPDGTPGPNYGQALQYRAIDKKTYQLNPPKTPYTNLPPALTGGPSTPYVCTFLSANNTGTSCVTRDNIKAAKAIENGLAPEYYQYLLTGGTGQPSKVPDARIKYNGDDASSLPPGPYQLTNPQTYPYDAYAASPVHRFYQMWQQLDCNADAADQSNGWGCLSDLFPWVEVTIGAGSNGKARPSPFDDTTTGEGSTSMGFYNMQQGDAPYLKYLADNFTMSDNYHQAVNGGTGANHVMLGTGDAIWFIDENGNKVPPNNPVDPNNPGTPLMNYTSALSEIENPDPQLHTNNYYTQDGYGGGTGSPTNTASNANYGGGSYVNCSDNTQPGVPAVLSYLGSVKVNANCESGHYYLLNNYNPGYFGDGTNAYTDTNPNNTVFTVPPSSVPTIGDLLSTNNISWAYYGDQFDEYLGDKYEKSSTDEYCNICNWAQYATSIMTNPTARQQHLKDTTDLYNGIQNGNLPAVSYVKPSGLVDGHPSSSKLILFEGFVKKIVDGVQANNKLWNDTAIFITFDEGGGYWDSGYVQPLDFFGDGTRIPMIVVSKYSQGGHISHSYMDHVSTAKFIEANWGIGTISSRSRDNLPSPVTAKNPYIPTNSPAIGDMMDMFNFNQ